MSFLLSFFHSASQSVAAHYDGLIKNKFRALYLYIYIYMYMYSGKYCTISFYIFT